MTAIRTSLRILLDQNIPQPLAGLLTGHDTTHAFHLGWDELRNGDLLAAAEAAGFAAMVTADQSIRYQQNLAGRRIALLVLSTNNWSVIRAHGVAILGAIKAAFPGSYRDLELPRPPLRRRPPLERDL